MKEQRPEMTLEAVYHHYCENNPRVTSDHTVQLVRLGVTHFNDFLKRGGTLADLTPENLKAYKHHREMMGRAARTIERELCKLSTLWRWAAEHGWIEAPRHSFRKIPPPTPTAWTRKELLALFKEATAYSVMIGGMPAGVVMVTRLRMLYETGERITATDKLLWSEVDLEGRWVTFKGENRKGGGTAKDNVQRFSRAMRRCLLDLKAEYVKRQRYADGVRVFPEVDRTTMYYHMKRILSLAGLPTTRSCSFHKLRRTHATHLYVAGGDPTWSLGHESDQMTRGYYLDPKFMRSNFLSDLLVGNFAVRLFRRAYRRLKVILGLW
ncbi:MAG: tyrosine-type recombinase/integrase [Pirellulales bacterium]